MVSEAVLTLILGSVIALVSTLGAILVQSYVSRKDKAEDRNYKQTERLNSEVYSPLLFYFFEELDCLGEFSGNLHGFSLVESTKQYEEMLLSDFRKVINLSKASAIKQLLLNKIAFIEPVEFRQQLFLYVQLINTFEKCAKEFTETGFNERALSKEIKWLKNLENASFTLANKTTLLVQSIDNFMHPDQKKANIGILTVEEFGTIGQLIMSRNGILASS